MKDDPKADRRSVDSVARGTKTTGADVGEAVGGVSGAVAGAAIGAVGGPIGTIIGGLAGAAGGWWAGHTVAEAAKDYTEDVDSYYRRRYESYRARLADKQYDNVRPAYQLGHLASMNPDYQGRTFDEIEQDLRRGWADDIRARHGDWSAVRPYAEDAYVNRYDSVAQREAENAGRESGEGLSDPIR